MPGATACVVAGVVIVGLVLTREGVKVDGAVVVVFMEGVAVAAVLGALFRGAPTEISQRWPGCPCAGLSPAVVVPEVVTGGAAVTGMLFVVGTTVVVAAGEVEIVVPLVPVAACEEVPVAAGVLTAGASVFASLSSDDPQLVSNSIARPETSVNNCFIVLFFG
jgi:hypothetical protein